MAISNVSSASSTTNALSSTNKAAAGIANNFDQFLSLLTTQLKNQSPLDPLDTNQFTQQLVQFAGVEQQIKTNDTLTSLLASNKATTVTSMLGFVGKRVTAEGNTSALKNSEAKWVFTAPRAGTATITITDKNGNQVASVTKTLTAGEQNFTWDGKLSNGTTAPDGQYKVTIAAKDSNQQTMTVKTEISGVVDGVDITGDLPTLMIGGVVVPVTNVREIRQG